MQQITSISRKVALFAAFALFFSTIHAQDTIVKDTPAHAKVTPHAIEAPHADTVTPPSGVITTIIGHDTVTVKDTLNIPSVGMLIPANHIGSFPLPAWLQALLVVLGTIVFTVLPAIQAVLKVIPTDRSVKIQGFIGRILDAVTGFIKDAKAGGGFHS